MGYDFEVNKKLFWEEVMRVRKGEMDLKRAYDKIERHGMELEENC